jgi:hypothetical protein
MGERLVQVAKGRARSPRASLHLSIQLQPGEPAQGNVFVSLRHDATGETWRALRWHRATRSFLFAELPFGAFTYRAWSSPDRQVTGHVELETSEPHHESIALPHAPTRAPFVFPVRDRLAAWRSRIAACAREPSGYAVLRPLLRPGDASDILIDLISDGALVAAITRPLAELGITPELSRFIEAHTARHGHSNILGSRARFAVITRCVGLNPAIRRRLAPYASEQQLWSCLLRVVATLDDPDLDDVFLWAARLYEPETASFEHFVRAWAERFNGLNNLRFPVPVARGAANSAVPPPTLTPAPLPSLDPAMVYTSTPVLADIAHIICAICALREAS